MLGIDLVYCAKRNEQNLINTLISLSIIRNISFIAVFNITAVEIIFKERIELSSRK